MSKFIFLLLFVLIPLKASADPGCAMLSGANIKADNFNLNAIAKACALTRDNCYAEAKRLAPDPYLGRRCGTIAKMMVEPERSEKLRSLGCADVNAHNELTKKCSEMNDTVGRLQYANYKSIPLNKPAPEVVFENQNPAEYFDKLDCGQKWRAMAHRNGMPWRYLLSERDARIRTLEKEVSAKELWSAANNAANYNEAAKFCDKYFPSPEI